MHPSARLAFVRTALAVMAFAVLSACGPAGEGPRPGSNPPSGPATSELPRATQGSVAVVNSTDVSIWYIYVSAASSSQWGSDQLDDNVLPSGGTFTITGVPEGRYDLKAITASGAIAYVWSFPVVAGNTQRITVY